MAIDSNSQGDERAAGNSADRPAGAGLKLVGDRSSAGAAAGGASSGASRLGDAGSASSEAAPGSASARGRRSARSEGRKLPLWMFVVLAILALIGFGYQTHQATQLGEEVVRLEKSLGEAEARLESHRTHLLEIRGGVHDLSTRLESLRDLIDRDPTADAALAAPPGAVTPSESARELGSESVPAPAPEGASPR